MARDAPRVNIEPLGSDIDHANRIVDPVGSLRRAALRLAPSAPIGSQIRLPGSNRWIRDADKLLSAINNFEGPRARSASSIEADLRERCVRPSPVVADWLL